MEMQVKYPNCYTYFIDLGNVWVFRLVYRNWERESVILYYVRRDTLELIHTEELTYPESYLRNNHSAPHFPHFYYVEI